MPITPQMITHLAGDTFLCVAVKATEIKPDGSFGDQIRFVNHTRNLVISGETYLAIPLPPTEIQQTEGLEPDNTQITIALGASATFTSALVRSRKWMGARVEYLVVNFLDTSMGPAIKKVGYIGLTKVKRFETTPELRSLSQLLEQPVGDVSSEDCRVAELGDEFCKVNLAGNTVAGYKIQSNATVTAVTDKQRFTVSYPASLRSGINGLSGKYYNGLEFETFVIERLDSVVDFLFGGSPAPGVNSSFYSTRWEGTLTPPATENYTIIVGVDDGARVWINNVLVIDQWNTIGTHSSAPIALTGGVGVPIKVEHHNITDPSYISLRWTSATVGTLVVIASQYLTPPTATTAPDDHWTRGKAEWLTGNNAPQRIRVMKNTGNQLTLFLTTNKTIQVGDTLKLTAGCDRKRATCRDKFANVKNGRFEPDLPGRSKVLKFPG